MAGRAGIAVVVSGAIALTLGLSHGYWAMAAAVLMVHQGFDWLRTVARSVERTIGTFVGLGRGRGDSESASSGPVAGADHRGAAVRHRDVRLITSLIAPTDSTISSGGHRVGDVAELLLARGLDTLIGCAVALLVYRLTLAALVRRPRGNDRSNPGRRRGDGAPARLGRGRHDTSPRRPAGSADGRHRDAGGLRGRHRRLGTQRAAAERLWPALVATEQLAYRTLAACWAVEHGSSAPITTQDSEELSAALGELARAVRTGDRPGRSPSCHTSARPKCGRCGNRWYMSSVRIRPPRESCHGSKPGRQVKSTHYPRSISATTSNRRSCRRGHALLSANIADE